MERWSKLGVFVVSLVSLLVLGCETREEKLHRMVENVPEQHREYFFEVLDEIASARGTAYIESVKLEGSTIVMEFSSHQEEDSDPRRSEATLRRHLDLIRGVIFDVDQRYALDDRRRPAHPLEIWVYFRQRPVLIGRSTRTTLTYTVTTERYSTPDDRIRPYGRIDLRRDQQGNWLQTGDITSGIQRTDQTTLDRTPILRDWGVPTPAGITVRQEDDQVIISWEEVDGAEGYRVVRFVRETGRGEPVQRSLISGSTVTDSGPFTVGVTYDYRIETYMGQGLYSFSSHAGSVTFE